MRVDESGLFYVFELDGKRSALPKDIVDRQGVNEEACINIIKAQRKRGEICKKLTETDDKLELKVLAEYFTDNEFKLQELWGFEKDISYHQFWNLPKCECPKLDNAERIGTGYSVYNQSCPLHGE